MTNDDKDFYRGKFFEELDNRIGGIETEIKGVRKDVNELLAVKYWALGVIAAITFGFNVGWAVLKKKFLGD